MQSFTYTFFVVSGWLQQGIYFFFRGDCTHPWYRRQCSCGTQHTGRYRRYGDYWPRTPAVSHSSLCNFSLHRPLASSVGSKSKCHQGICVQYIHYMRPSEDGMGILILWGENVRTAFVIEVIVSKISFKTHSASNYKMHVNHTIYIYISLGMIVHHSFSEGFLFWNDTLWCCLHVNQQYM